MKTKKNESQQQHISDNEIIDSLKKQNKALRDCIDQQMIMAEYALLCYNTNKEFAKLPLDGDAIFQLKVLAYPKMKEHYLKYMIKQQMLNLN